MALPVLVKAFDGIPFDSKCPDLLVGRSVTEWEVKSAVLKESDPSRYFWMRREFDGGVPKDIEEHWMFNDVLDNPSKSAHLDRLLEWMENSFPLDRVHNTEPLKLKSLMEKSSEWERYRLAWSDFMGTLLSNSLEKSIQAIAEWNASGHGLGVLGGAVSEMLHHCLWAKEKCSGFVGRESLLNKALRATLPDNERKAVSDEANATSVGGVEVDTEEVKAAEATSKGTAGKAKGAKSGKPGSKKTATPSKSCGGKAKTGGAASRATGAFKGTISLCLFSVRAYIYSV